MVSNGFILMVEDNPDDEELILMNLRRFVRNTIAVTRDGQEALDFLRAEGRHAERDPATLPVVVMLDLSLPKLDGFEVLKAIRTDEVTRTLPVVVLTSSDLDEDRARSYDLGCNAYVRKPVEFTLFAQVVERLGLFWVLVNKPPPTRGG